MRGFTPKDQGLTSPWVGMEMDVCRLCRRTRDSRRLAIDNDLAGIGIVALSNPDQSWLQSQTFRATSELARAELGF